MKRITAFGLCFLLLAGCTNQHEADLLQNESMESSGNITTDIDYEWYLWGNTYVL